MLCCSISKSIIFKRHGVSAWACCSLGDEVSLNVNVQVIHSVNPYKANQPMGCRICLYNTTLNNM